MSIWVQLKLNRMLFFLRMLLAVAPGGVEVCSVADDDARWLAAAFFD